MARLIVNDDTFYLSFGVTDSLEWAKTWPGSALSGKRGYVEFDSGGLSDAALPRDVPNAELNAFIADMVRDDLPKDHPCYYAAVGQFAEIHCLHCGDLVLQDDAIEGGYCSPACCEAPREER